MIAREFWWENMPGPFETIARIGKCFLDGRNLLLVTGDLGSSWKSAMRTSVMAHVRAYPSLRNLAESVYDWSVGAESMADPVEFACRRIPGGLAWREGSGETLQHLIVQEALAKNQVWWIANLSADAIRPWLEFCGGFPPNDTHFHIVLETEDLPKSAGNLVDVVDLFEGVEPYDIALFSGIYLRSMKQYERPWREYFAVLLEQICGTNAELAASLIDHGDLRTIEIEDALSHVRDLSSFSDGLSERIWAAQLQSLFPRIDNERCQIVEAYYNELISVINLGFCNKTSTELQAPEQFELTDLWTCVQNGSLPMPSSRKRARLYELREFRNKLAHLNRLSIEEVRRILFYPSDMRPWLSST